MRLKKAISIVCLLALGGTLAGCGTKNELKGEIPTIQLVAYNMQEEKEYTIDYKLEKTADVFSVVYAYEQSVLKEGYGKSAIIDKMTVDTTGKLYIQFNTAKVMALGVGSELEQAIFTDLIKTVCLNCPTVTEIYFFGTDGDLETGHLLFRADEPVWRGAEG